jgi:hypothetical protein
VTLLRAATAIVVLAAAGSVAPSASGATPFKLTSPAFKSGATIPVAHTCDGANSSPKLVWTAPPKGTRSFALILDDPDAPSGTFTHWTGWRIKGKTRMLPAGERLPVEGTTSFGRAGYGGPCPPPGDGPHRYRFMLYALEVTLTLPAGSTRAQLAAVIRGHVLRRATLTGIYER